MTRWSNLFTVAALGVALSPASALADSPAAVSLTVPASASTGSVLSFQVASSFTQGANGSQALSVFLLGPQAGSCPARAIPPPGADVVLAGEAADQVLIVNALSAPLSVPGTWTVCGYLTDQGAVTASASQTFDVTGAPVATHPKTKHAKAAKRKSKTHAKTKAHSKTKTHGKSAPHAKSKPGPTQ